MPLSKVPGAGLSGGSVVVSQTAPDNSFVIDTSGNVGIGTSSPAVQLHVSRAGSNAVRVQNTTAGAYVELGRDSTSSYVEASGATSLQFWTNANERMRIDSSGRLFIGTTSTNPTTGAVCNFDTGGSFWTNATNISTNWSHWSFKNSNGIVGQINTSGSGTTYTTSSDYRLKENIAPMTGALVKVSALKPCTYTWKSTGQQGEGFIAHELAEVCPDAVVGEKDAVDADGKPVYQGIDTSFLVATLTAAIQEQQQIINDLKARIETLEAK